MLVEVLLLALYDRPVCSTQFSLDRASDLLLYGAHRFSILRTIVSSSLGADVPATISDLAIREVQIIDKKRDSLFARLTSLFLIILPAVTP